MTIVSVNDTVTYKSARGDNDTVRPADLVVVVNADGSPVGQSYLPAGTSRSGSITLGGTAQDLAAANTSRKSLTIQNISSGDLWINENGGTASVEGTDAYRLTPGAWASVSTNEKVSIIGATTGQKFTAMET